MFRWLRYKIKLGKINRQRKKLDKEGERKQAEGQEKKDEFIFENWRDSYGDDAWREIEWERQKLVSNYCLREADERHLPRPKYADKTKWEEEDDEYGGRHGLVLTVEAITELRATIRKEKREANDGWIRLLPIITGLIGALIGLVSVLKHIK